MTAGTQLESKFVTVHGRQVRYLEGGADGPPLVLIHGLTLHQPAQMWVPSFDELGDSFHLYAMDLYGWGMSEMPAEYSFRDWIDSVAGLVDALQLETVDLMAYSFGSWIAALYAAENPSRVRRLVSLHNPGLNAVISQFHPTENFDLPSREEVRRRYPTAELGDMVYDELVRPGRAEAHVEVLNYIGRPEIRQEWSLRPHLSSLTMPVLSADRDTGFVKGTVEVAASVPTGHLLITPSEHDFEELVSAGKAFLTRPEIRGLGVMR
ncbi:MAG: alpha/beta fold hydrolase [Dehalococcoidia bacterium]